MNTILGAILVLIVGVVIIIWTAHFVLDILGWILVVAAVIWMIQYLVSSRGRSNL